MPRLVATIFSFVVMFSLQGCQSTGAKSLTETDRAGNHATTDSWLKAVQTNNWDAVAATYTADAILLPPENPVVVGRGNIRKFFAEYPPFADMKLNLVEVDGRGDFAYVRGVYSMTIKPPGVAPIHDVGKYVEIRRRQADGSWLIWRDIFNSDNAPPK